MKLAIPLAITLALMALTIPPARAISFEKVEANLKEHRIDSELLGELLNKQVSDWQTLTPTEKEMFAKGMIINSDLQTAYDSKLLEEHTKATIQCMDTKGHGLKLPASEDISLPLVRCITDTFEAYRQKGHH